MDRDITCESIWDLLSTYADGEATPAEAAVVERHTFRCADCARDLRFMRETAVVLSNEPDVAPPPGLHDAILAATIYRQSWYQRMAGQVRAAFASPAAAGLGLAGAAAATAVVLLVAPNAPAPQFGVAHVPNAHASAPAGPAHGRFAAAPLAAKRARDETAPKMRFRLPSTRKVLAGLPKTAPPVLSGPPDIPEPALNTRGVRRGPRPVAIAAPRRRPSDIGSAAPGGSALPTPPIDPSPPVTGGTERVAIAASPPMPATGTEGKMEPVRTPPVEVHLQLVANNTVNASGYASLAGLRAKIHHDNQRAMSAMSELAPEEHRVVTVDLYKSHF